jgi:hypothetical protein
MRDFVCNAKTPIKESVLSHVKESVKEDPKEEA